MLSDTKIKRVVIFGAGDYARELLPFVREEKSLEVCKLIDASPETDAIENIPVEAEDHFWSGLKEGDVDAAVIAVADSKTREKIFQKLEESDLELINVVHASAVLSSSVSCAEGTIIYPFVCVHTHTQIGRGVLLNTGVSIGHDGRVADFVTVNPGANIAGNVHIKRGAFIGIGASVIEDITIGENTIVGAGAAVIKDIPDNVVAVGVPAKVIKKRVI